MEFGEVLAQVFASRMPEKFCDEAGRHETWTVRVTGYCTNGSKEDPTGTRLAANLLDTDPGYTQDPSPWQPSGVTQPTGQVDLSTVTDSAFPSQAHHLIPKSDLPGHPICAFLCKSWSSSEVKYQLRSDSCFDSDDARNGYFMPYASSSHQWSIASKDDKNRIVDFLTCVTGIQLHQGKHATGSFDREEDGVETGGYLETVQKFLKLLFERVCAHCDGCPDCAKPEGDKVLVYPSRLVVEQMFQISQFLRTLLKASAIFVSKRAHGSWCRKAMHAHPTKEDRCTLP
jgi:hypothetical protein